MAALRSPVRFAQERKNEEARSLPLVSIEIVSADEATGTRAGSGESPDVAATLRTLFLRSERAAEAQRHARGFAKSRLVIAAETAQIQEAVPHGYRLNRGLLADRLQDYSRLPSAAATSETVIDAPALSTM